MVKRQHAATIFAVDMHHKTFGILTGPVLLNDCDFFKSLWSKAGYNLSI